MRVSINGTRLFIDVVGSSLVPEGAIMREKPAMLVLHGGPGYDHALMRPYFDRFADVAQVIYVDHRGNGRSGGAKDGWSLDQWGDDIASLIDLLGLEKPIVLGLSFGGMVAMNYGGRHAGQASKLILISTAAAMDMPLVYSRFEALGGIDARKAAEAFWQRPDDQSRADYLRLCMPLYTRSGGLGLAEKRAIARPEVLFHFAGPGGEQRSMDLTGHVRNIKVPTLVLAGGQDPITPPANAERIMAALAPGLGTYRLFPDCGHGPHRDDPAGAEAVLRAFIAG